MEIVRSLPCLMNEVGVLLFFCLSSLFIIIIIYFFALCFRSLTVDLEDLV